MVAFEGRITKAVYVRAQRLHMRPRRGVLLAVGAYVVAALVGLPLVIGAPLGPSLAPLVLLALLFTGFWLSPRFLADRALRTSRLLQEPFRGVATETAVQLATAHGSTEMPWEVFFQQKTSPDMVLLYPSALLYNMFPRELFASDADWRTFKGWAESKVPRRGKDPSRTVLKAVLAWLAIMAAVFLLWQFMRPPS